MVSVSRLKPLSRLKLAWGNAPKILLLVQATMVSLSVGGAAARGGSSPGGMRRVNTDSLGRAGRCCGEYDQVVSVLADRLDVHDWSAIGVESQVPAVDAFVILALMRNDLG